MLDLQKFCKLRPTLYHLAAADAWPSIQRHGLLSSNHILHKFGVDDSLARKIELHRLRSSYRLTSKSHGSFTLRDRTTLSHATLRATLDSSCTPEEWIDLLSQRVFFFAQQKSLQNLLRAPLNRELSHVVLDVDTKKLFQLYSSTIQLSDINTGYTKRKAARRGLFTFQSPATYRRTGNRQIIEVTVLNSVVNILPLLQRAILCRPGGIEELLHRN